MYWDPWWVRPVAWSMICRAPEKQVSQELSRAFESGLLEMGLTGMPLPKCTQMPLEEGGRSSCQGGSIKMGKHAFREAWTTKSCTTAGRELPGNAQRDGHPGVIKNLRYVSTQIYVLTGCTVTS